MFQLNDILGKNFNFMRQTPSLEDKLNDTNYPLEEYLKDDEAITCVKLMGKNTKKYFDSEKVKKLIKYITEEPIEEDQLRGHKFPYIACEILKCDCPFISKRFILKEQEYDEEYGEIINEDDKDDKDDKEIDFDFCKTEFDSNYSKIEEKLKNIRKRKLAFIKENNKEKKGNINNNENNEKNNNDEITKNNENGDVKIENNEDKNEKNNGNDDNIINDNNDKNDKNDVKIDIDNLYEDIEINDENDENDENNDKCEENDNIIKENNNIEDNNKNENKDEVKNENEIIENKNNNINENNNENMEEYKKDNTVDIKESNNIKNNEENNDNKDNTVDLKIKNNENKENIENKENKILDIQNELNNKKDKEEIKEENKNNEYNENNENISEEKDNIEKNVLKSEEIKNEKIGNESKENTENQKNEEKKEKKEEQEEQKKEDIKDIKKNEEIKENEKENILENKEDNKDEGNNKENNNGEEGKGKGEITNIIEEDKKIKKEELEDEEKTNADKKECKEDEEKQNDNKNKEIKIEEIKENIIISNNNEIKEEEINNKQDKQNQKEKEKKELEDNQEEGNEELDNIIIDKEINESDENNDKNNIDNETEEINFKKDEDSLSIEGEIDDFASSKKTQPKKKYEDKPNNEYLDLLLNFVMNDKPELNFVLSGYFANVMITLIDNYPSQMIKYLYTQRKDAIKKIISHSNQKAFAILSLKILNIETFISSYKQVETNTKELILSNINFRNELIGDIIKSIILEGYKGEKGEIEYGIDVEGKFALISDMINENKNIIEYIISNNEVYTHIFDILNIDLYNIDNNCEKNDDNYFNNKYSIYGLFINLITKLIKNACLKEILKTPTEELYNFINKDKKEISFSENLVQSLGKIIKNNFMPKKPKLILEQLSTIPYDGLGILNIKILEFIKEMISFMKEIPKQFDNILIRNNFWEKGIDYFFEYQWNNIYHNQFVELFNLYLLDEEKHKVLTDYLFNNMKLHNILINYLIQDKKEEKENQKNIPKQKIKFYFKSGNSIKSGVYPHIIDLIYKIQSISGLLNITQEEKIHLKIKNFGEFEFSKDEKSNKLIKKINTSDNIKNLLKDSKTWNDTTNNIVIPLIKKYEGQLCKEEEKKYDSDDNKDDSTLRYLISSSKKSTGNSSYLLQQLLNVIKGEKNPPNKRFSLPISRNDKNKKPNNDKSSLREKLLNKGRYRNQKIFDDDEDENKDKDKDKDKDNKTNNNEDKKNEENNMEEDKKYNDTNFWEIKNGISEELKKEVDKKTNIIFNYNPITCEKDNKNDISEEDELLSIAMGLEQNEKIEKKKKKIYIIPGKLKPINLKAKTNPVQNIFSSNASNNNNDNNSYNKIKLRKKINKINIFDDNDNDNDNENNNIKEKQKEEKINIGENEENEEEEIGVIKKEEKNEIYEKENEDKNIENNNYSGNNIDNENENNKKYNDVNFWGISSNNYFNKKEMDDLLEDL